MAELSKKRVVVAMSGGVDSSVAAVMLKEQGYEVIGISMKTHETPEAEPCDLDNALPTVRSAAKNCCSVEDIMDARAVCRKLAIPFYAMNFKEEFKAQVMDYFAHEYANGRTPNPCVKCNDQLKFKALLKEAHKLGAYYLATGHYVKKIKDEQGTWHIFQAEDLQKDQSYFLFGLDQPQLKHTLFPLADLTKAEVRELGRQAGITTAEKPESQEICFVPNNDYASVLEKIYPEQTKPKGLFKNSDGKVLGEHQGTHAYTIGQRRGLNIATGERIYVTAIDSDKNEVILGENTELFHSTLSAKDVNWVCGEPSQNEVPITAKIRYRQEPTAASVKLLGNGKAHIHFKEPQRAITPGQAIVFYQGQELVGGGWIEGEVTS